MSEALFLRVWGASSVIGSKGQANEKPVSNSFKLKTGCILAEGQGAPPSLKRTAELLLRPDLLLSHNRDLFRHRAFAAAVDCCDNDFDGRIRRQILEGEVEVCW